MKRVFDARHLDVAAFAKAASELQGEWPLAQFDRLADALALSPPERKVAWHAAGHELAVRGGPPQVWLHLRAHVELELQCQRCLQACSCVVQVDRRFLFVAGEHEAEKLDADFDDDVLALTRELDLQALLEDELLLSLPLVPRHADCAPPVATDAEAPNADAAVESAEHPFAALAAWRRRAS